MPKVSCGRSEHERAFCSRLVGTQDNRTHTTKGQFHPRGVGRHFRELCGKLMLSSCGTGVNIYKRAKFGPEVELGDNSDIGFGSRLVGKVVIGANVMMGPEVAIWTRNHSSTRTDIPMIQQGVTQMEPVIIGDDVWIGSRVTILPGVSVGTGAIVGAGAIVTHDVPPYSVVAGNPVKGDSLQGLMTVKAFLTFCVLGLAGATQPVCIATPARVSRATSPAVRQLGLFCGGFRNRVQYVFAW